MKHDYFRSQFRLPNDLYDRLKESAERNGRSLNAELVARLEASFQPSMIEQITALLEAHKAVLVEEIRNVGKQ